MSELVHYALLADGVVTMRGATDPVSFARMREVMPDLTEVAPDAPLEIGDGAIESGLTPFQIGTTAGDTDAA